MYRSILSIDGMACSMCEAHVCDALRQKLPLQKISASYRKGTAEIISDEPPQEEAIRQALEPTGYRLLGIETEAYEKKHFRFGKH